MSNTAYHKLTEQALRHAARYVWAQSVLFLTRFGVEFDGKDPEHQGWSEELDFVAAVEERLALLFGEETWRHPESVARPNEEG